MKSKVYIRADGNADIGLGHVVRSLALAQMLYNDFECTFFTRFVSDYIWSEAVKVCKDIVELESSNNHFEEFLNLLDGTEIVVLDNYFYDTDFQRKIKSKGCKLVCIDDIHSCHFVADIVINHAGGVLSSSYSVEKYTQLLLGTDYALLRPVFLGAAIRSVQPKQTKDIFVCFGGADKYNLSFKLAKELVSCPNVRRVHLVIGQAYKYIDVFELDITRVIIHQGLSPEDMYCLMDSCSLAIIPASTICYEIFSVKVPAIIGYYVDNQINIYNYFVAEGAGIAVGNFLALESGEIADILNKDIDVNNILINQQRLIDGRSKERILKHFKTLC